MNFIDYYVSWEISFFRIFNLIQSACVNQQCIWVRAVVGNGIYSSDLNEESLVQGLEAWSCLRGQIGDTESLETCNTRVLWLFGGKSALGVQKVPEPWIFTGWRRDPAGAVVIEGQLSAWDVVPNYGGRGEESPTLSFHFCCTFQWLNSNRILVWEAKWWLSARASPQCKMTEDGRKANWSLDVGGQWRITSTQDY